MKPVSLGLILPASHIQPLATTKWSILDRKPSGARQIPIRFVVSPPEPVPVRSWPMDGGGA